MSLKYYLIYFTRWWFLFGICKGLSLDFQSSELFILPLTHFNFSIPTADVSYRPSLNNMPDLPSWMHYTFSPNIQTGFVYGTPPPGIKDIKLEVIATEQETYNISKRVFDFNIQSQLPKNNEICFKLTNFNVDEILVGNHIQLLKEVLVNDLWSESEIDGSFTSLVSASVKGDRLPLNPQDREGLYICYGSSFSFSDAIHELEIEVKALWKHRPCPKYFKRTSYERFFRQKGFAIDWCNFKLYTHNSSDIVQDNTGTKAAIVSTLNESPFHLRSRKEIIPRSYVFDVIYTILIPLMVMVVLLTLLTLAMCCHRSNMDIQSSNFFDELFDDFPKIPTGEDIRMVHYAGVNRATTALRSIKRAKSSNPEPDDPVDLVPETEFNHSPHLSLATNSTHMDTIPRSRTGSPSSTMPRHHTPSRRFEDFETLTRPEPPPYSRNC